MVDKYFQNTSKFEYNSKYTAPIKEEYKQWLKKNHPGEYYDQYGGKKPFNRLSKFGKVNRIGGYAGLAGVIYELGKAILDFAGNIPNDMEEREILRRGVIKDNIPKIVVGEDGKQTLVQPDPKSLKDHLPYKKYLSDIPSVPGSGDEVEGVDYVWVAPYQEMFPIDTEGYELSQFGWVKPEQKTFLQNQADLIVRDVRAIASVIPPEIKEVGKNVYAIATGNPKLMEKNK